jgi:hypothetical protein
MRMETIGSCTRTAVMCGVVAIVCVWVASPSCTHEQRPWLMRAAVAVISEYEIPKSAGSQLLLPALVEIGGAVGRVTAVSRTVLVRHFSNPLSFECEPAVFPLLHPPCRVSGASQAAAGGRHSCAVVRHPDGSEAVFSFGRGEEGQLGHGSTQDSAVSQSPCRKSWRAFTPASCRTHTVGTGRSSIVAVAARVLGIGW